MAQRGEAKGAVGGKATAMPTEERQKSQEGPKRAAQESVKEGRAKAVRARPRGVKSRRAKAARAKAARTKPGGAKSGRAKGAHVKPAKTAEGRNDAALDSRLARLEQMMALQAERSDELLEKVEAVLTNSNQPGREPTGDSP